MLPVLVMLMVISGSLATFNNGPCQFGAPVLTQNCLNNYCACNDDTIACPGGSKRSCTDGEEQQYCCPAGQTNPFGGMGMGGLGGFGGLGMGMGMPGSMCGCSGGGCGGLMGMMGGMGGMGCGGGSMCQAPMFAGIQQQLMFQRQMQLMMLARRMQQPRLGMSIRICTCPPGLFSNGGMCRPFGQGQIPIGGQCQMGFGMGGMGMGGCVPNAMCQMGMCQCQPGYIPTGQYCSPFPYQAAGGKSSNKIK